MKTELTKEQSQHLIDLGVPKEKASDIEEYSDPVSQWTHRGAPIFKLEDFLNGEILPKEIDDRNRIIESGPRGHFAYYIGIYGAIGWKPAEEELIDALYELACWYYGEYLKSKKK